MATCYLVMTSVYVPLEVSAPLPEVVRVTLAVPAAIALPPAFRATVPSLVPFEVTSKTEGLELTAVMVEPLATAPTLNTTVSPTLMAGTGCMLLAPSAICGVIMIGGSTFPTVDEDFAVVVVDEESLLSELHPARARPATARTAIPPTTSRFFKVLSEVSEAVLPVGNVVVTHA